MFKRRNIFNTLYKDDDGLKDTEDKNLAPGVI